MRVKGKMAFVTGGASGLGRASSIMLAREGAKVAVTDINLAGAEAVAAEINSFAPGHAFAYELNVTDEQQWQSVLQLAHDDMGGLNVLLNNADNFQRTSMDKKQIENKGEILIYQNKKGKES